MARGLAQTAGDAAKHAVATVDDWAKLLEQAAVYASIGMGAWLSRPDPYNPEWEMSDDDARAIMAPFSRLIARSRLNRRWGHVALAGGEYLECAAAVVAYGVQIAPAINHKLRGDNNEHGRSNSRAATRPTVIAGGATSNGATPADRAYNPADHTQHRSD